MELFGYDLSEDALENLTKASDFQAEYSPNAAATLQMATLAYVGIGGCMSPI